MILLNDFFLIQSCVSTSNGFDAVIGLSKDHLIYKGHFPGFPVTPGVVQLQIVHESIESFIEKKIKLRTLSNCKFLQIIDPNKCNGFQLSVEMKIENTKILKISARAYDEKTIFFKVDADYIIV